MDDKKIIKKQKVAIIILSILFAWLFVGCMGTFIYAKIDYNKVEIKFTKSYTQPNSLYDYSELEILCKQDKIFNVNDFTFIRNGENVCVSKIKVDNKIYDSGEIFTINKYEKTTITLYLTLIGESQVSTIYYNSKPINWGETKKYIHKKNKVYKTTLFFIL